MLQDSVEDSERYHYLEFVQMIGWFFFDLFLLGYVEDPNTGLSFRLPGGLKWEVYVEVNQADLTTFQPHWCLFVKVPFRDGRTAEESLKLFCDEVPVLELLSTSHYVGPNIAFAVDSDVQLVCKYLRPYRVRISGKFLGIDKLYKEKGPPVKFSLDQDLNDDECHKLLQEFMPKHAVASKMMQKLFIR